MLRSSLLLVAAALAAGGFGCAHCDTCDDFPAPCTGPNCGFQGYPIGAEHPGGSIIPLPVGPAEVLPPGPPVGGPVADPGPMTLPPSTLGESPIAPDVPPPLPDSPPPPDTVPNIGPSTPMP